MIDPPSYSAVRTLLARLEGRGLVRHREADQAYVYEVVPAEADVRASALQQIVRTLFDGSAVSAATALLGLSRDLDPTELDSLQKAIDAAREARK
jgi:predicted transcriptional regulator